MNINLTLIGQAIAFSIFVMVCMRYIWPVMREMLDERAARIEDGLKASDAAKVELERAVDEAENIKQQAKQEAGEIIAAAGRRANQRLDEAKVKATAESERILEAANAEVAFMVTQARGQLKDELSTFIVSGASQVLQQTLEKETAQTKTIKRFVESF